MKKVIIVLTFIISSIVLSSCESPKKLDSAIGTYYFVYEYGPMYTRDNLNYKIVLDGKGKGEYHKDDSIHKIKYEFDKPDIIIKDNTSGIIYKGTLSKGELLLYDGRIGDDMTSEFLFKSKNTY